MHPIDTEVDKISHRARSLLIDFLDYSGLSVDAFFATILSSQFANEAVQQFFRFCAQLCASAALPSEVEANVLFMDLSKTAKSGKGQAASWLLWGTTGDKESVSIVIDTLGLNSFLAYRDSARTKLHLAFHEIGHLVLHRDILSDGAKRKLPNYPGVQAHPEHESEAWWFCYSFLGQCIAELAFQNRQDTANADDQIWRKWFR